MNRNVTLTFIWFIFHQFSVSGCKVSLKETFEASQTLRPHAEPINERKPRNWLVFTFIRFNVRGADPAQLLQNESQGKDRERDSLSCAVRSAPSNVRFDAPHTQHFMIEILDLIYI